jgi:hypothetical protein
MNSRPTASPAYSYAPGPMDCFHSAGCKNARARGCKTDETPEDYRTDATPEGYRTGAKAPEQMDDRPGPTGDRPEPTGGRLGPELEPGLCCCSGPPPSQESTTKLKPKVRLCLSVSHSSSFTSRQPVVPIMPLHSNSVRNRKLREIAEIVPLPSTLRAQDSAPAGRRE